MTRRSGKGDGGGGFGYCLPGEAETDVGEPGALSHTIEANEFNLQIHVGADAAFLFRLWVMRPCH